MKTSNLSSESSTGAKTFHEGLQEPVQLFLTDMRSKFSRVPSLDGFRAVSISIVLASHFISANVFPGGFGVLVFFVVSGFLITRLLFAEARTAGNVSLGNFYMRRIFRLYPVIVVYTLCVVAYYLATSRPINWVEPASALFYFANYLYAYFLQIGRQATVMPFSIFWSLSIEEHFYLIFPVFFVLVRGSPSRICRGMLAVIVLCLVLRFLLAALRPDLLDTHWFYYTELRLDSIAFGVLLAGLCELDSGYRIVLEVQKGVWFWTALAILLICFVVRIPWFRETLRYTLQGACVTIILAATVFSRNYRWLQRSLNWGFVRWIGILSYSLYVWHYFVLMILNKYAMPHLLEAALGSALSVALAAASYYGLEKPSMGLRHRFGSRTV